MPASAWAGAKLDPAQFPRRRIALIGHACSPVLGSEPGFVWNWASRLCKVHDVTVFAHPVFRDHVEAELAARPLENLRFVWVQLEGPGTRGTTTRARAGCGCTTTCGSASSSK